MSMLSFRLGHNYKAVVITYKCILIVPSIFTQLCTLVQKLLGGGEKFDINIHKVV